MCEARKLRHHFEEVFLNVKSVGLQKNCVSLDLYLGAFVVDYSKSHVRV